MNRNRGQIGYSAAQVIRHTAEGVRLLIGVGRRPRVAELAQLDRLSVSQSVEQLRQVLVRGAHGSSFVRGHGRSEPFEASVPDAKWTPEMGFAG